MDFLIEYGLFTAKLVTVVVGVAVAVMAIIAFAFTRSQIGGAEDRIEVKKLNDKFHNMGMALKSALLTEKQFKAEMKQTKKEEKSQKKRDDKDRPNVFVCEFHGDLKASAVESLREEVTAILAVASDKDEVVALVESPGGTVHGYGLAASQLARFKKKNIALTVAVDKVAASGGYMMACVADKIIAAPFAIIGSIGVVAQLPNFNRLLKKHDIDFEQVTAGEYKRTLTMFGENTDADREKFKEEIEDAHVLFKEFVHEHRPQVEIDKIATGEHWFAKRALELKMVDELITSDDYLFSASEEKDVFQISFHRKKPVLEKMLGGTSRAVQRVVELFNRAA
ncbi:MAG: protease SohB [Gammaproteobacteria bacterium]